jgi:hypothetical protein
MQNLPNIEKSAFRRGEYVGYADGVWSISRHGKEWIARKNRDELRARTLREMSSNLEVEAMICQLAVSWEAE